MNKNKIETSQISPVDDILKRYSALEFSNIPSNEWFLSGSKAALEERLEAEAVFRRNNSLDEPSIQYPKLNPELIMPTDNAYQDLLNELLDLERTPEVDMAIDKIINRLGELYRYEEICLALGAIATEQRDHLRIASEHSLEMMGGVDERIYNQLAVQLTVDAQKSNIPEVRELVDMVGHSDNDEVFDTSSFELQQETIDTLRGDIDELFPQLKELRLNEGTTISARESIVHFKHFLDALWLHDWIVEEGPGKTVSTLPRQKKIIVGVGRDDFTAAELYAIQFHEVFGHARRSEMATHQPQIIARRALPGSLDFDEGLCTALEQIMGGKRRIAGKQYYMAIGLQAGVDRGGVPRSYRQTYEVIWRNNLLEQEQAGVAIDVEKAKMDAQKQVQRTRRGGAIDTRDSAYFVGAQKAYAWLNDIARLPIDERREKLLWVLSAVFDPTEELQASLVETIH